MSSKIVPLKVYKVKKRFRVNSNIAINVQPGLDREP